MNIFVFYHNFNPFSFGNTLSSALLVFFFFLRYNCLIMTLSLKKNLIRRFFNAIGAADFAAENSFRDEIVLSKQVFVAFGEKKKLNITGW